MKKIIMMILASFFVLPCFSHANTDGMDIGSMLSGEIMPNFSQLSDEQKAQLKEEALKEGTEVIFNDDGTTTFKAKDGTVVVQEKDGTMSYKDEQGKTGNLGMGQWPDNEFTQLVPKPEMTVSAAVTEENSFSVLFSNPTKEQLRAYADQVKQAGFDIDASLDDQKLGTLEIFMYTASHKNGMKIEVFSAMGASGMTIEK